MNLAILSDTHGSSDYIRRVVRQIEGCSIDTVIHLGDDYRDADVFLGRYRLERVPGTWGPEYQSNKIENRYFLELMGWRFALSHTLFPDMRDLPGDIDPTLMRSKERADVFLHGHTHQPECVVEDHVLRLNPGHLKQNDHRGYPPTWALVELSEDRITVDIIKLLDESVYLHFSKRKSEL